MSWEYKGRTQAGVEVDWLSEDQILKAKSFTPLQLDGFIALWHLYHPNITPSEEANHDPRAAIALSRKAALQLYPIGTHVQKDFGSGLTLNGQVFDFKDRYWRVRYTDNNWEEVTRTELKRLLRA
ncbi:unnamed protein product [Pylaiella littoralis]